MKEEAGSWKPHSEEQSACLGFEKRELWEAAWSFISMSLQNAKGEP